MPSRNHAAADPRNAALLAHLGRGGTVLTAGRREARHLRRLFDSAQLDAGREVWRTADVMPLAAWLAARWAELVASDGSLPTLLDEAQAVWPWRARVAEAAAGSLLAVHDLAGAARAAWISLRRHNGTLEWLDGHAVTRDQRMFQGWAQRVESDLAASGWLDPGMLEVALHAQAGRLEQGRDLLVTGTVRRTPAFEQLLDSLARLGHTVTIAAPAAAAGHARLYAARDPADEVQALANWLRNRLLANPAASLAAIVPDLAARRAAFERQLESILQPELEWPGAQPRDRLFLGIDHTAFVVADTEASLAFYRDQLGFRVAGESINYGPEQERLNAVFGARLRITGLRVGAGPGIEFLEYLTPQDGRPAPGDTRANDIVHWQTTLVAVNARELEAQLRAARARFLSPSIVTTPSAELGFAEAFLVRDPDGHVMQIITTAPARAAARSR